MRCKDCSAYHLGIPFCKSRKEERLLPTVAGPDNRAEGKQQGEEESGSQPYNQRFQVTRPACIKKGVLLQSECEPDLDRDLHQSRRSRQPVNQNWWKISTGSRSSNIPPLIRRPSRKKAYICSPQYSKVQWRPRRPSQLSNLR